ncbi:hypothetical protein [Rhizobium rosettiformans]|nr:hypothetical protein [Rhizobium rosettiformans]
MIEQLPSNEPILPQELTHHLQLLPPALRTTFLLAVNGQTQTEIRHLLSVNEVTLRQRICEIRKRLRAAGLTGSPAERLSERMAFGSIRQALRPMVRHTGATLATHDPDGHLICFGRDLTKSRPAAT